MYHLKSSVMSIHQEYETNSFLTYIFYDTKFQPFVNKMGVRISKELVEDFQDDTNILDYLYKSELATTFQIENIENIAFDKYDILRNVFATTTMQRCIELLRSSNLFSHVLENNNITHGDTKIDESSFNLYSHISPVSPIFFSYDIFFFTHLCIQDFVRTGEISKEREELLIQAIRDLL